jgi:hypothetical protein
MAPAKRAITARRAVGPEILPFASGAALDDWVFARAVGIRVRPGADGRFAGFGSETGAFGGGGGNGAGMLTWISIGGCGGGAVLAVTGGDFIVG